MIYPTITINLDNSTTINIYDTDFNSDPVLSMGDVSGDSFISFYKLLNLFLNQYTDGFNEGYEAGFDDAETEGDITYGEYDE